MAQDEEPRIPVLNFIDQKLANGGRDGYRYFVLPDDDELWRLVARGLAAAGFDNMTPEAQKQFVDDFSQAKLHGEPWSLVNVAFAWEIIHRDILTAFYSHPWAWNAIGFGGPAYPRGYSRFGSRHLPESEREPWEGREAISWDPGELRKNNSGIGVGGSMTHFAGYVPRFHPSDFEVRSRDGVAVDWPISYWDLKPYFERVERELPVAGQYWPWGDPHGYPHGPHPVAGAAMAAWEGAAKVGIEMRVGP